MLYTTQPATHAARKLVESGPNGVRKQPVEEAVVRVTQPADRELVLRKQTAAHARKF